MPADMVYGADYSKVAARVAIMDWLEWTVSTRSGTLLFPHPTAGCNVEVGCRNDLIFESGYRSHRLLNQIQYLTVVSFDYDACKIRRRKVRL